nr:urease accessory protein UreD [Shimwellia pseudoproteus]
MARLALQFECVQGKTVLASTRRQGPLTVQRPFYPEGHPCHLYLLHPPGGVVGGDRLDIHLTLNQGCHTLVTMPGATKFYRSGGPQACVDQQFQLADGAILEWLPQDSILFPGARVAVRTVFSLAPSSVLLAWDLLCLGQPVRGEPFSHGDYENRLEVWLAGEPLSIERLSLCDGDLSTVAGYPWVGSLLFWPGSDTLLEDIRHCLEQYLTRAEARAGATLNDGLLSVRILARDNLACQQVMRALWQLARPQLTGCSPHTPRIWNT